MNNNLPYNPRDPREKNKKKYGDPKTNLCSELIRDNHCQCLEIYKVQCRYAHSVSEIYNFLKKKI